MTQNPKEFLDFFLNSNHGKKLVFLNTILEGDDFSQSLIIYQLDRDEGACEKFDSWNYQEFREFNAQNPKHASLIAQKLKKEEFKHLYYMPKFGIFRSVLEQLNIKDEIDYVDDINGDEIPFSYYLYEPIIPNYIALNNAFRNNGIKLEGIIKELK